MGRFVFMVMPACPISYYIQYAVLQYWFLGLLANGAAPMIQVAIPEADACHQQHHDDK